MMKNTTIKAIIASKMNLRTGAPSRILMGSLQRSLRPSSWCEGH